MRVPKPHHLIYGTLHDYLTGEELTDTDDERIRQELSRMMVEEKGYARELLTPRLKIETLFSRSFVTSTIELTVTTCDRQFLIIRYGPGSLVSRERAAIAAARVLNPDYRIPLAVVTNGSDAELLDTRTGKILGYGLESIPDSDTATAMVEHLQFLPPLDAVKKERELRILNAFDVERCCF
ncbi:MAG: type I restriction enzyme HsdR N-terminal domain-containing protein [Desulforhopalus sp.]